MAHPKRRQSSARQGKEDHTTMPNCPQWQFVQTVVHGIYITQFAMSAATIEENWL